MRKCIVLIAVILTACNFEKSIQSMSSKGVITKGIGLSCERSFISLNDKNTDSKTFIFGEVFKVNFSGMSGFKNVDGKYYPGMKICVTDSKNDTLIFNADLYEEPFDASFFDKLNLFSIVTIGNPIHSNENYTLKVNIWDKKGNGKFVLKMNFDVKSNEFLSVESEECTYDEIYLFSDKNEATITDNQIVTGENVYVIHEGLKGFKEVNGQIVPGMSIHVTDDEGNEYLNLSDLNAKNDGISPESFAYQIAPNFVINHFQDNRSEKIVHCIMKVWDKNGSASVTTKFDMTLKSEM